MTPEALGDYCRQVELHLTRVNGGHLVRIVGPGFDLVRGWAEAGIPISVVFRGIELKAERHRAGASKRPLRIEFCDADVLEVFDQWRRATGVGAALAPAERSPETVVGEPDEEDAPARRVSLSKHLARVVDRLGRAAGRLELSEEARDVIGGIVSDVAALRERAASARGQARDAIVTQLASVDEHFAKELRRTAAPDAVRVAEATAETELAAYRDRLNTDAWQRALDATVDRLLREKYALPTIRI